LTPRLIEEETVTADQLKQLIEAGIPEAQVRVADLTGTGDHFQVEVVSPAFEGKLRVEQHRMVYAAVGSAMAGPVHALALKTYTPAERAAEPPAPRRLL
jgi:stress-induced morphogen